MSPIGRVFIVLNLVAAAGFAFAGGQLLKNQHNYKEQLEKAEEKATADLAEKDRMIERLESERTTFEVAKSTLNAELDAAKVQIGQLQDQNKHLTDLTTAQGADLKKAVSLQEAANTQAKAAFEASQAAYTASIEAGKVKDDAVRAKDAAEAENRNLKNTIASLNETIEGKNQSIASLERDNDEQRLLVAAAKANGFIEAMAAPTLAGTVTNASGNLLTISVADNPGNVDIQDQIERNPFRIAIYDDSGFKAEAVATRYEPSANAILCNVMFRKGDAKIRTGDKASTKP